MDILRDTMSRGRLQNIWAMQKTASRPEARAQGSLHCFESQRRRIQLIKKKRPSMLSERRRPNYRKKLECWTNQKFLLILLKPSGSFLQWQSFGRWARKNNQKMSHNDKITDKPQCRTCREELIQAGPFLHCVTSSGKMHLTEICTLLSKAALTGI